MQFWATPHLRRQKHTLPLVCRQINETRPFAESYTTAHLAIWFPIASNSKVVKALIREGRRFHKVQSLELSLTMAEAILADLYLVWLSHLPLYPDGQMNVFSETFQSVQWLVVPKAIATNDWAVGTFRRWFDKPNLEVVSEDQ